MAARFIAGPILGALPVSGVGRGRGGKQLCAPIGPKFARCRSSLAAICVATILQTKPAYMDPRSTVFGRLLPRRLALAWSTEVGRKHSRSGSRRTAVRKCSSRLPGAISKKPSNHLLHDFPATSQSSLQASCVLDLTRQKPQQSSSSLRVILIHFIVGLSRVLHAMLLLAPRTPHCTCALMSSFAASLFGGPPVDLCGIISAGSVGAADCRHWARHALGPSACVSWHEVADRECTRMLVLTLRLLSDGTSFVSPS